MNSIVTLCSITKQDANTQVLMLKKVILFYVQSLRLFSLFFDRDNRKVLRRKKVSSGFLLCSIVNDQALLNVGVLKVISSCFHANVGSDQSASMGETTVLSVLFGMHRLA